MGLMMKKVYINARIECKLKNMRGELALQAYESWRINLCHWKLVLRNWKLYKSTIFIDLYCSFTNTRQLSRTPHVFHLLERKYAYQIILNFDKRFLDFLHIE